MKQNLLTKHCALLLLLALATAWSTPVKALTINVNVTGSQAPYVYAWDNAQTPLTDAYPGTQLTNIKKVGGKTWYYIDLDATSVNVILSFGTDDTKTGDITGIAGNRYFEFANNNANNVTDYYDCPGGFEFEASPFVYLVDTRNWNKAYAYVWNGDYNNGWPGDEMEYLGTNGNGNKVYRWSAANLNFTPANVKFNNVNDNGNATEEGNNLGWINGAFWSNYNYSYAMTVTGVVLNSTYFPDANLRKAITASTNVAEDAIITPDNITVLDISYDTNKGMTGKITDPTGIEKFTALEELYARDNSLTHLDLTHTTTLRILDVSGNNVLQGMRGTSYCNATGHGVNVKGNNNFKKLIADDCSAWIYNAGLGSNNTNYQYISSLEYISQKNNPLDGWSSGFEAQINLKYLDLTNTGQNVNHSTTSSRISVSGLTNLETLILANNTNLCSSTALDLTHNTNLIYLDLSNTGLNETRAKTTLNTVALSNLETLKVNKNPNMASAYTAKLPNLKHFEIADGDLYFTSAHQLSSLTPTNNPNLEYLDISNDQIYSSANPIDGFQNLKTVIANGNPHMPRLTINNCPAIESVDVSNNTTQTILSITNSALTTIPAIDFTNTPLLTKIDLSNNNFTAVPEINNQVITTMVLNNNQLTDIVAPSNINYLYAQNNNFGSGDYTLPTTSLVGLDLGNNGFTKFKAENNTSLKSLALAGNTNLTEIELHGNTALTQTSPDGVIESDNGLYIKGLSNLKVLNIENSSFNKLGQQNSLEGVTGLTKLQARHNEFTTFTNGVYALHSVTNSVNYRPADANESSLEHLVNLQYLDLAYNNLRDSVHLYRNKELRHLDVSHNAVITGVKDGTITTKAQKDAMIEKKGKRLMKYNKKYTAAGVNASDANWTTEYADYQSKLARPFDLRECDLNDTIGLYHLDLQYNTKLEWLDFSNTAIRNTASGPTYMCPGWMDKDWVTDDNLQAVVATAAGHRWYSSWHSFIYLIPCSELKTIHADNNNMQSMGFMYFPKLDTLTISGMYGDCAYMRDYGALAVPPRDITPEDNGYGKGNCGLSGSVRKYVSTTWGTGSDGNATASISFNYIDPETGANYLNPVKYFDVSNSGYNEVRLNSGVNLEYANVSGNPLNYAVHNTGNSYHNSLDVTYCPNIRTVLAENCADLPVVRAHNRTKLDTLYLSNDANLKTLYVQNDPVLKANFQGLNTLTGLETLFGYNNTQWGNDINFLKNTALKNLWVSNIGASAIDVSHNTALEKLRVYDNSLEVLNVASNPALTWLDLARNQVPSMDLSTNVALQYFNCSNSEETLDDQSLAADSHNGGEADNVKPVTSSHSANDTGNSLSDLVFNTSAPVADVRANSNDLHKISGNFTNLTNIEFAHNHINGIDLSAATGTPNINSEDNGRAITAECAKFYQQGQFNPLNEITVFYFQLEDINANGQTVDNSQPLASKTSEDSKGTTRHLGQDGFILDELKAWNSSNSAEFIPTNPSGISPKDVTVDPSNMNQYLAEVPGRIVVLKEDPEHPGEGRATYTYNNGKGESEFYLDWTADSSVPTAIENMKIIEGLNIVNTTDGLTVTGADGTVVGVYDLNGRQVASETISGGKITIDGLAPGIYIVNGNKVLVK